MKTALHLCFSFLIPIDTVYGQNVGIGTTLPVTRLHITGGTQASYNSGSGYMVIGSANFFNLVVDENELVARNNGNPSFLSLNYSGGDILLGVAGNGNVGIGEFAPKASLHLYNPAVGKGNVLFEGLQKMVNPGNPPISGSGTRTFWYSDKAAFRSGVVNGTQWDKDNIGQQSMAWGSNTIASGLGGTAWGNSTVASGNMSTAFGVGSGATAFNATVWGNNCTATGTQSTAWGYFATASGDNSTAAGYNVESAGNYAVALGRNVGANGNGSFIFGDSDPNNKGKRVSISNNLFWSRFNGGYYLVSSDAGADIGVRVLAGDNSWTTISDKNLKENFELVDGEALLKKLAAIPQYTWNYKGQDPETFRHYGPMAQDFYAAFGQDDYGTIGCDTLINQHDFTAVNMVAIQALEKRTSTLQKQLNDALQRLQEATTEIKRLKQE